MVFFAGHRVLVYYPMQTYQMFIICNDLVGAKNGFHCLECDLVLKYLLMWNFLKIIIEDFLHDIFLITHNHLLSFIILHIFNQNKYMVKIQCNHKIYLLRKVVHIYFLFLIFGSPKLQCPHCRLGTTSVS
jgi:hypothetical protein